MDPRKALNRLDFAERQAALQDALDAAADGDGEIRELADALAGQFPHFGRYSALELLARIGWKALDLERDLD